MRLLFLIARLPHAGISRRIMSSFINYANALHCGANVSKTAFASDHACTIEVAGARPGTGYNACAPYLSRWPANGWGAVPGACNALAPRIRS